MTTEQIKKFYDFGLINHKALTKATGIGYAGIFNRFDRGKEFTLQEINELRRLYWRLFVALFPYYCGDADVNGLIKLEEFHQNLPVESPLPESEEVK